MAATKEDRNSKIALTTISHVAALWIKRKRKSKGWKERGNNNKVRKGYQGNGHLKENKKLVWKTTATTKMAARPAVA